MKRFKIIDVWISILLVITFITLCLLQLNSWDFPETLIIGYIVVGAWQVLSMIVHAFTRTFTYKWGARYIYHWITFIALVTIPGTFWILVVIAPFMAVYYTWLCYHEVTVKMKRPLALLK